MQKTTKILLSVSGATVAFLAVLIAMHTGCSQRARRVWKEQALLQITQLANDPEWVSRELALLKSPQSGGDSRVIADGWLTDSMILMRSGEWLIYRNHCSKEALHGFSDIFLAKGSDGRWYYSTYHFCVKMVNLIMMQDGESPKDIASFASDYFLQEFDGKSDECLQSTCTLR